MDILRSVPRVYLKDYVFVVLLLLYVFGPLEYVASFMPTLWSIPSIFILSALVWNAIEAKLSKQRVKVQDKAIFISGCGSGFGFELAKRMSNKGFYVFAGCRSVDCNGAKTLSKMPNISVLPFDITKEDSISHAVEIIKQKLEADGKILWAVVANAGVLLMGPFEWCSMTDIQNVFNVNVFGTIRTAKAFLPLLKKSRGRFVISASVASMVNFPQIVAYSMTKAALRSLSEGLNREMGDHTGIRFITIMPAIHKTPMLDKSYDQIEEKLNALPDSERKEISPQYIERCKGQWTAANALAITDLSQSMGCFNHALTSTRPRPSYICDRLLFLYTMWPIATHFPTETTDAFLQFVNFLVNSFFKSKK